MFNYLKGIFAGVQRLGTSRMMLILEVNQVGYELQVPSRMLQDLPAIGDSLQVFTHLQVREDHMILYGFSSMAERDLFRQLTSVSGIGPQLALALLDTFSPQELVQVIASGNTRLLARTPGVGAKTADRITLELRDKLTDWREQSGLAIAPNAGPVASVQEDVENTLLALGYSSGEIMQALRAVGQQTALAKNSNPEEWIKEAIAWLSR